MGYGVAGPGDPRAARPPYAPNGLRMDLGDEVTTVVKFSTAVLRYLPPTLSTTRCWRLRGTTLLLFTWCWACVLARRGFILVGA